MTKLSVNGRAANGATRSRTVAAAARAAARRAEKAQRPAGLDPELPARSAPEDVREPDAGDAADAGQPTAPHNTDPSTDASDPGADARDAGADTAVAKPRRRAVLISSLLALLVVTGLAATAVLGWDYRDAERTDRARTEALAAARTAAPRILSYDYRHLDRDFATARRHLTGPFREKYGKTTTTVVAPTAKRYHGVVKATVATPPSGDAPAASVVSASPDKVVVLLFMNQVTNSTQVSGPRLDLNRVRMTLQRTSQGWKVSAVDAL